jgi:phosphoenolpyruvate-protein phosphotransferase (PTS system enzyme I)
MSEPRDDEIGRGRTFSGRPISPGYGAGTAYVYHPSAGPALPRRAIDVPGIAGEQARLARAIQLASSELREVQEHIVTEIGETESAILDAHLALLEDPDFIGKIQARITDEQINAEAALGAECEALVKLLSAVDNEYIRERAHDIVDIKNRLLKYLGHGPSEVLKQLPPGTVLVARDLLPSDTLNLDRAHVAALVLQHGAPTSHAAILARAMGVPAVGSLGDLLDVVSDGASILVDGERGEVVVDPDPKQAASFGLTQSSYERDTSGVVEEEWRDCVTRDGCPVSLLANIGRAEEIDQVERHHLAGVGLFRTEYLFMQAQEPPTFEQQREVYLEIVQALQGRPVVIRTLDLGGDKRPRFAIPGFAGSAPFGMRGLRLSLHEKELFSTQVRAIVEVARDNNHVAILLPMVISAEDVSRATSVIDEVSGELGCDRPSVGAMLETPSVLFELEDVLGQVDFVAVGTNDLVQFMLAVERRTVESLSEDAIFQPAILRAVHHIARRAALQNKPLSLCGEAAGDPLAACLLVGLGIDRLSMSPVRAARVRAAIRKQRRTALKELATTALAAGTRSEVMKLVHELHLMISSPTLGR